MAGKKDSKNGNIKEKESSAAEINKILDEMISHVRNSPQMDSYYKGVIDEILAVDPDGISLVTRKFVKAGPEDRELLLDLLKHFTGIEHINFLQRFIKNEVFLPKTGARILDVLNKSDLILEEGITGMLLELENMTQRIKHAVLTDGFDDSEENGQQLVAEFLQARENEKEGIIREVIADTGGQCLSFLIRVAEKDAAFTEKMVGLIADLPENRGVEMLQALFRRTTSKAVKKQVKRTAHTLKQKGLDIVLDMEKPVAESVFKTAELPEASAYSSIIDAEGHRFIFAVKPVSAHENKIFNILLSDSAGIKELEVMTSLRKEARALVKKILADKKTEFFEIPLEYAAALVAEARDLTEKNSGVVSANISQWNSYFGDITRHTEGAYVYTCMDVAPAGEGLSSDDIRCLFDKKDMTFWFLTTDLAKQEWVKITDILKQNAGPEAGDVDKQIRALEAETLTRFFDAERLDVFKRRLEEVAYYFHVKDQPDKAMSCLKAAQSFAVSGTRPSENLFCREVIRTGFDFFITAYQEETKRAARNSAG